MDAPLFRTPARRALAIFIVAALVRVAVGATLWSLPLVRTPRLDSAEYYSWAQRLAAGESAWPVVAQHGPGYPFFLAALLALSGSLVAALVLQALVCACTAVLVAALAERTLLAVTAENDAARRSAARAGLLAGLAYALYGPAVYVETVVLGEGLLLLLLSLALWALARERVDWYMAALAGGAIGAAALVRPTAIVIAGACLLWLVARWRTRTANPTVNQHKAHAPFVSIVSIVSFVFAGIVVILPAVAKNYAVSRTLSIQGYGGLNVYIGNSPLHDGRATFRLGGGWDALNSEAMRSGITDPAAQDRYYLRKTFSEIAAHPGAYLALLAKKALWMVQAQESRDSHSYYFFTERSALLRILPRFGVLFPLACVGALFVAWLHPSRFKPLPSGAADRQKPSRSEPQPSRSKSQPSRPWARQLNNGGRSIPALLALYAAAAAATIVFLVVGFRYRMPLVPVLVIFAGIGVDGLVGLAHQHRVRELLAPGAVALAAVGLGHVLSDPRNTNVAEEWAFTGSSLITEHNLTDAEAAYRRAIELDPRSGLAWDGLGLALYDGGRLTEARSAFDRALAIDPESSRAAFHLALVDEREGRIAQAAAGYERALALSPYDAEVKGHLGAALRKHATELGMAGRTREARDEMRRALDVSSTDGEAWLDLCLLSLDLGERDAAAAALARAKTLGADPRRIAFAEDALKR